MKIYLNTTNDFNNNGLGFLTDVINAKVFEELNGEYYLEFEYLLNGQLSEYLTNENIIKCKVHDGTDQLFIITNIEKNLKKIKVTAKHIFYRLLNNFLEDVYPKKLGASAFLDWILSHTQYESGFTGFADVPGVYSARYIRKNPVEAIIGADNSMVNLFGGEIKRDNFNINFLSKIGTDKKEKLIFGKNIKEIKITIDADSILTRIMPIGANALILPEKYIDSPYIDSYIYPKIGIVEFNDIVYDPELEETYHDIEEAYSALREETRKLFEQNIDVPSVNVKIDWLELSKTNEYKNYQNLERLRLGDSVICDIAGINYSTRVISTLYNPLTDMVEKYEIGSFSPNIASSMNKISEKAEQINPTTILQLAKDSATSLITQAMGGYIYKTQNELYIMDTDDLNTAQRVWRWNINGLGYSRNGINGPYELAMTMDGSIVADMITTGTLNTNVINGYDQLVITVHGYDGRISQLVQTVDELNSKISDIADITISGESNFATFDLENVNQSEPITIKIHPVITNISYLYPNNNIYPTNQYYPAQEGLKPSNILVPSNSLTPMTGRDEQDILYPKMRTLRFENLGTGEIFDYEIPSDLLYYDENTYDEFYMGYESNVCQITKRCAYDSKGRVYKLSSEEILNYEYPTIALTDGDYKISLLGYSSGYLFVRLMTQNIYTSQYATKIELNSSINQTINSINLNVEQKLSNYSTTNEMNAAINIKANEINQTVSQKVGKDEIISRINQTPEQITINANKLNLQGYVTATDLSGSGTTTINGANITTGTISANRVSGGTLTGTTISGNTITGGTVNGTSISGGSITIGSNFSVNSSGKMVCNNAEFKGELIGASFNGGKIYLKRRTNDSTSFGQIECESMNASGNRSIATSWLEGERFRMASNTGDGQINMTVWDDEAFLGVSGEVNADNFVKTSLATKKKNFEKLTNSLEIIKSTDIYKYHYKTQKDSDKKDIGLVIGENYNYSELLTNQKNNSVNISSMIGVCFQAIKEQQKQIEKLQQEIKLLKKESDN